MSTNRDVKPELAAPLREDYAAMLVSTMRITLKRPLASLDGKQLMYVNPPK
jgi:hypothetical protein